MEKAVRIAEELAKEMEFDCHPSQLPEVHEDDDLISDDHVPQTELDALEARCASPSHIHLLSSPMI